MKTKFLKIGFCALILCAILALCSCSEDSKLLPIDYENMTYVGTSLKDFSPMFDEQMSIGNIYLTPDISKHQAPKSALELLDADNDGDLTDKDKAHVFEVTVDFGLKCYVECFYVYFGSDSASITAEAGTPFSYEEKYEMKDLGKGWHKIEIDYETRYVNLLFDNEHSPWEILFYGYATSKYEPVNTEAHNYKDFSYFLGANGNRIDSDGKKNIKCASYFRDYINWAWLYDKSKYPNEAVSFGDNVTSTYTSAYSSLTKRHGVQCVPCFMFPNVSPALEGMDKTDPNAYVMYSELIYQTALRFGNNPLNTEDLIYTTSGGTRMNLDYITWIEAGNEPNGEGNDGFTPYELAALTSCAYDGHVNTVKTESKSGVGIKNADPNMKLAMAGLAGIQTRYIKSMVFWMENNRSDGKVAMDAFNVHTYCKKLISFNGYRVYVGVCPEIGGITDEVKELCEYRDKYYPDIEVWVTEFGWDTNTSYETENACHPYANFTARQLQAMWLVRAYFMFASVGVDRAAMYMIRDEGDEATGIGKYGTSGVVTVDGEYKDSYYYISTLKATMNDMHFAEIIDSGNENVWIYRFENGEGKSCYALWCPTMDDIKVDGFKLNIDGTKATLTEFENGDTDGVSTPLTVKDGRVTVNVSEKPILIFSE